MRTGPSDDAEPYEVLSLFRAASDSDPLLCGVAIYPFSSYSESSKKEEGDKYPSALSCKVPGSPRVSLALQRGLPLSLP